MEKLDEDEEKSIEEEASNSVAETRSDNEDERIRGTIAEVVDPVGSTEEVSTDPSNSQTVTFEDHDVNEYEMEDDKVLELFRRKSGLRPEVAERNNFPYLNKSEEMLLQFQEETPAETEQTNLLFHSSNNPNPPEIHEGIKASSSNEDTEDSSSNSDLDSSLSRYYFDGSLPVSTHVEESETHQDENQIPLLCPNNPVQQPTSWRNCCGLLELLRSAHPLNPDTRKS